MTLPHFFTAGQLSTSEGYDVVHYVEISDASIVQKEDDASVRLSNSESALDKYHDADSFRENYVKRRTSAGPDKLLGSRHWRVCLLQSTCLASTTPESASRAVLACEVWLFTGEWQDLVVRQMARAR